MTPIQGGSGEIHELARYEVRPEALTQCLAAIHEFVAYVREHEPAAALFLSDPEDEAHIDDAMVRRLYGLTPAEARLAVLLAQGHHLDEVGDILKISIHTARTHLKRIFGKTNTSSQSDLIRLVLSAPPPIRTA